MKKVLLIAAFTMLASSVSAYELDGFGRPTNSAANSAYSNHGTTTWDGYGKSYTRQGNQVNSSDGSVYKPYDSSGRTLNSGRSCTPNFSTGGCL